MFNEKELNKSYQENRLVISNAHSRGSLSVWHEHEKSYRRKKSQRQRYSAGFVKVSFKADEDDESV